MAVAKEEARTNPKKRVRIAQEKGKGGLVSPTAVNQKPSSPRSGAGEVVVYLLIFGLVLALFLNFMGIVKIPFLQFLTPGGRSGSRPGQDVSQEITLPQEGVQPALYQGPQLEVVGGEHAVVGEEQLGSGMDAQSDAIADGITVAVETEQVPEEARREESMRSVVTQEGSSEESGPPLENVYRVAKIYAAMEPQEAVRILEKFSDEEVVLILGSMRERQVAEILKGFPVERAAEIARKMMKGR